MKEKENAPNYVECTQWMTQTLTQAGNICLVDNYFPGAANKRGVLNWQPENSYAI